MHEKKILRRFCRGFHVATLRSSVFSRHREGRALTVGRSMQLRFLAAGLSAAIASGCGKESMPPAGSAGTPPTAAAPNSPGGQVEVNGAVAGAPDQAQIAAVLAELTQAVRKYGVEQRRAPKSLDELVAAGYLGRIPPGPRGKRFAIDKNLQVYLANE